MKFSNTQIMLGVAAVWFLFFRQPASAANQTSAALLAAKAEADKARAEAEKLKAEAAKTEAGKLSAQQAFDLGIKKEETKLATTIASEVGKFGSNFLSFLNGKATK